MIAHEMYARKIELTVALRAPRDVEHPRMLRVLEILHLLQFRPRLCAVRRDELLILRERVVVSLTK